MFLKTKTDVIMYTRKLITLTEQTTSNIVPKYRRSSILREARKDYQSESALGIPVCIGHI